MSFTVAVKENTAKNEALKAENEAIKQRNETAKATYEAAMKQYAVRAEHKFMIKLCIERCLE